MKKVKKKRKEERGEMWWPKKEADRCQKRRHGRPHHCMQMRTRERVSHAAHLHTLRVKRRYPARRHPPRDATYKATQKNPRIPSNTQQNPVKPSKTHSDRIKSGRSQNRITLETKWTETNENIVWPRGYRRVFFYFQRIDGDVSFFFNCDRWCSITKDTRPSE